MSFATVLLAVASCVSTACGQAHEAGTLPTASGFLTGDFQNSQYPAYADNALGLQGGVFVQPRLWLGAEVRAGVYPVSAAYSQVPATAGFRAGMVPGDHPWEPYAYVGVGVSRAEDKGLNGHPTASHEDLCWQTSLGVDHQTKHFMWRVLELTFRRTYTPVQDLRTLEMSTGFVYRFKK